MNYKHHTCCGQRKRYRSDNGKLVEQPHECQRDENKGVDWEAVKREQTKERA